MPFWRSHTKQRQGQPIQARTLRQLAEDADKTNRIQANPPLAIVSTAGGPLLRLAGQLFGAYIVVTTSTITARSGGTPGSGTAKVQTWNGTALADLSGPVSFTVYSISSTTGGIPSGTYCVVLRIAGNYWLIAVDCGN